MGQKIFDRSIFPFTAAHGELRSRPLDQVIEIFLRILQRRAVGFFAFAADIQIGIESLIERQHFESELFFDQQAQSALGRFGPSGVGIEVHDGILAEPAQQFGLQFGERRARAGDHVMKSGGEDRDAVHLAFDQDGVVEFLDPFLGEIKIEQNLAFGVDGGLG
jgi:hypothetical protein